MFTLFMNAFIIALMCFWFCVIDVFQSFVIYRLKNRLKKYGNKNKILLKIRKCNANLQVSYFFFSRITIFRILCFYFCTFNIATSNNGQCKYKMQYSRKFYFYVLVLSGIYAKIKQPKISQFTCNFDKFHKRYTFTK